MNTNHPLITKRWRRGQLVYIVAGVIACTTYEAAVRLADGSEIPYEMPAEPAVLIDYTTTTRMRCLTTFGHTDNTACILYKMSRPEARGDVYI